MKIVTVSGGMLPTNCYLLTDEATGLTVVIDPGFDSPALVEEVKSIDHGKVIAILLTHGHFDHIMGVEKIKSITNAPVYIHTDEVLFSEDTSLNLADMFTSAKPHLFSADVTVRDGDTIALGDLVIKVIHTPGHTIGSCCYCVNDVIFTGDTLMKCSAGRTDFPTGSYPQLISSLEKLQNLPGNYQLYPGHGEQSTLEYERKNNPFLRNLNNDINY